MLIVNVLRLIELTFGEIEGGGSRGRSSLESEGFGGATPNSIKLRYVISYDSLEKVRFHLAA